jgi:hypothetical protein
MGRDGMEVTEHTTVPSGMVHHHRGRRRAVGNSRRGLGGGRHWCFRFSGLWFQVGERDTANRSSWERLFCFVLLHFASYRDFNLMALGEE